MSTPVAVQSEETQPISKPTDSVTPADPNEKIASSPRDEAARAAIAEPEEQAAPVAVEPAMAPTADSWQQAPAGSTSENVPVMSAAMPYSNSAVVTGAPSITHPASAATGGAVDGASAETAPPMASAGGAEGAQRMSGKCNKWLDHGYGFISTGDGGNYFVHQTQIHAQGFRSLHVGEDVEFELEMGKKGKLTAVRVTGPGGVYVRGGMHNRRGRGGAFRGYRGGMTAQYNPQMQMYAGYSGQMMDQQSYSTYAAAYGAQAYAAASYGTNTQASYGQQYQQAADSTTQASTADQSASAGYGSASSYAQQSAGTGSAAASRYQPY